MVIANATDALALLVQLGASDRLVRHHELVLEAAGELLAGLREFAPLIDSRQVEIGAAVHDAGKILHPAELIGPGSHHEPAGQAMLLAHGLGDLARFCVTHAAWHDDTLALEDRLVALADKLWKGKRVAELEQLVVEQLASRAGVRFWDVFAQADELFERVAAAGDQRLARSI